MCLTSDSLRRVQNAQQVVVAVARTLQFYMSQSDVQMGAQTQLQVVGGGGGVGVGVVVVVAVVTIDPPLRRFRPTRRHGRRRLAWKA